MKTLSLVLSILDAILRLSGASSFEELGEARLEHYYHIAEHPVKLNEASRAELLALDFLSPFEVASILDYRTRSGDILSVAELGSVIGIDSQKALDLSYFLSFESPYRPSQRESGQSYKLKAYMRNGLKNSEISSLFKLEADYGPWSLALSSTDQLQNYHLSYSHPRFRLLLGSFNLHYGQGLLLWSGFSMSSVSSPSFLVRNPAPALASNSSSASYALKGASLSFDIGQFSFEFSAFDRCLAARLSHYRPRLSLALSALHSDGYEAAGVDLKSSLGQFTLWNESAVILRGGTLSTASIGGIRYNIAYQKYFSLSLRAYSPQYQSPYASALSLFGKSSDQWALSLGYQSPRFDLCLDGGGRISNSDKALRSTENLHLQWELYDWSLEAKLRHRLKIRPEEVAINELKAEIQAQREEIGLKIIGLVQKGRNISAYAEMGWSIRDVKCQLAYFDASLWAERIYAYSPDVPGSFAIRQYYGRGYVLGLYGRLGDLALKLSYTGRLDGRSPLLELRMYLQFRMSGRVPSPEQER
ncbi:MAG: ComEA family DNA-binding protein [Candidatus Cryptobacteroides sp.]